MEEAEEDPDLPLDSSQASGGLAGAIALRQALRRRAQQRRRRSRSPASPSDSPAAENPLDPPEGDEADAFLRKQGKLLDIQIQDLHEQRHLQISHMRLRRLNELLKLTLQLLTALVGVGVAVLLALLVLDAVNDRALVIDPLRTPPDMARRGLDGTTLATQLLDKLRSMENATDSARAPQTYTHDWGQEIKVEIPETGVSIGELRRYLRSWLGHETHISGELYSGWLSGGAKPASQPDGLFLTVRAGSAPGDTTPGADPDLDDMMQLAAEHLFEKTQPYRHAVYLARQGRIDDALTAIQKIAAFGSAEDRPWAYASWGGLIAMKTGDLRAAAAKARAALRLDPEQILALDNLAGDEAVLGHEQAAADGYGAVAATLNSKGARQLAAPVRPILLRWAELRVSASQGNWAEVAQRAEALQRENDYDGSASAALVAQGAALALMHDVTGSRALLAGTASGRDAAQAFSQMLAWDPALSAPLAQRRTLGDWAGLADSLADSESWGGDSPFAKAVVSTRVRPWRAYALAQAGDIAGAEQLIATTPTDCNLCMRMRGRIAALKRDWPGAERAFVLATAQAPRLPFVFLEQGAMRLERGDPARALESLREANRLAPRYADPLELWGEALAAQGDLRGAVAKFAAAEPLAPRWGRLHLRWGQALARIGRRDEARAHWRTAAGLDLSDPDRIQLRALQPSPRAAQITPAAASLARSASLSRSTPPSTSSLWAPSGGPVQRTRPGVADSLGKTPCIFSIPSVGSSTSTMASRAAKCGSASISGAV